MFEGLNGRLGVSDPEAVKAAQRASGLSQAGLAKLMGVVQPTVSGWSNGRRIGNWHHRMLVKIAKVGPDVPRVLYFLVKEDRLEEALGICLGAPLPFVAPLPEVKE